MTAVMTENKLGDANPVVNLNRNLLVNHGIVAISVAGSANSGKTSLLEASIAGLGPEVKVGIICCVPGTPHDCDRMMKSSGQVISVHRDGPAMPDAMQIYDALQSMDLSKLDLLFIESRAATTDGPVPDMGEDASVMLLSADGEADQIERHVETVRSADVIILNKADLFERPTCSCSLARFRAGVREINNRAELFELSALNGSGMVHWLNWLQANIRKLPPIASHWFG